MNSSKFPNTVHHSLSEFKKKIICICMYFDSTSALLIGTNYSIYEHINCVPNHSGSAESERANDQGCSQCSAQRWSWYIIHIPYAF